MTSTAASSTTDQSSLQTTLPAAPWLGPAIISLLVLLLFRVFLLRTFRIATDSSASDWSHALIVPLISLFFISQHRQKLAQLPRRVTWAGLPIMFLGIVSFIWWIYPGRNDMLQGYSMIVMLLGLVLFLVGWHRMAILWFPIVYLAFGVKVADRIWEQIAWKLQLIAAKCATIALNFLGIDATVSGSTIALSFSRGGAWVTEKLNVAEACSGLRMLMAFLALGTAMAFLTPRAWWQRTLMVLLAVPIAVTVNVVRVTVLGVLFIYNPAMAQGDFHKFVGLLMLIPAAGLFWLLGFVLDRLVIEEDPAAAGAGENSGTNSAANPATTSAAAATPAPASNQAMDTTPVTETSSKRVPLWLAATLGIVLTTLIGSVYGLFLATLQPQLLNDRLSQPVLITLLITCVLTAIILAIKLPWALRGFSSHGFTSTAAAQALIVGILATSVLGLDGVVGATRAVLIKQPVPLRQPLFTVPAQMGSWSQDGPDEKLTEEVIEQLGTRQFIFRSYRDSQSPDTTARLHVAYYTGTPDTVPHVPERCYVAAGLAPLDKRAIELSIHPDALKKSDSGTGYHMISSSRPQVFVPQANVPATLFTYASGDGKTVSHVAYFFAANGKFLASPDQVRLMGFDPRDRHSYYCKIEIGITGVDDPQLASQRAASLLTVALPEIMACLPDWNDVLAGRWPETKR